MGLRLNVQSIQAKIARAVDEFRVLVQKDGGDLELVKIENNKVYVKLHGVCVGCPFSWYTLKIGLEDSLKKQVSDSLEVISVS